MAFCAEWSWSQRGRANEGQGPEKIIPGGERKEGGDDPQRLEEALARHQFTHGTEKLACFEKATGNAIKNDIDRDPPDQAATRPSRDRPGNLALSLAARFAMTALGTSRCQPFRILGFGRGQTALPQLDA
jgi:hypothetical protein